MNKRIARTRRAKRTRMKIRQLEAIRLCVNKTPRHMYAQVTTADGSKTLVCASTLEKELKDKLHWVSVTCNAYQSDLKLINNIAIQENIFNRNSNIQLLQVIQSSRVSKYPPHMNCSEY